MSQHELCTKIHLLKWENRDKISKCLLELHPDKCDHDRWLSLVNEIENRVNWQIHLEHNAWCSYVNDGYFKPEEVKWTLDDYVYNR